MMLVDSSVWIGYFNGTATPQTHFLRDMLDRDEILVGDLILCEVLQGFRHDKHAAAARELMLGFHYRNIGGRDVALRAADMYRALRAQGVTVRKTIDVLIGSFCILNGVRLLHDDRDFDVLEERAGLSVMHPGSA